MSERADGSTRWIIQRATKAAVAAGLCAAGARWMVRAWARRRAGGSRVLILSYHRVTLDFDAEAEDSLPSLLVSTETLCRQLEQLGRERDIVSLADARRILAEPPHRRARRPEPDVAAITFDDGYRSTHGFGLPLLVQLRVPATIFVATGYLGTDRRLAHDRLYGTLCELRRQRLGPESASLPPPWQSLLDPHAGLGPAATLDRLIAQLPHDRLMGLAAALEDRLGMDERELPPGSRLLSWDEARELSAAGIEIAGHSVSHAVLPNVTPARARAEIEGCRDEIQRQVGERPRHFAYPNGYHNAAVRRLVAAAGFEAGVTTEDRENRRAGDPYALCRKVLWENSSLGATGYSRALAACNLDGVFGALGLQRPVPGERSGGESETEEPEEAERAAV